MRFGRMPSNSLAGSQDLWTTGCQTWLYEALAKSGVGGQDFAASTISLASL